jgi:hypothetical protein
MEMHMDHSSGDNSIRKYISYISPILVGRICTERN